MIVHSEHRVCIVILLMTVLPHLAWGTPPASSQPAVGRQIFSSSCAYCHGQHGYATALLAKRLGPNEAMLEARSNLPPELIRHVVRHGIRGMPWYRRAELSDEDLDAVITYLTSPRSTP